MWKLRDVRACKYKAVDVNRKAFELNQRAQSIHELLNEKGCIKVSSNFYEIRLHKPSD